MTPRRLGVREATLLAFLTLLFWIALLGGARLARQLFRAEAEPSPTPSGVVSER